MPSLTTSDGRKLAWRETGSGPPLLLHSGGPGMSSRYFGDLPLIAAECTLVLLDPRGTGDSDRPADSSAYDLEDYADDVEAVRAHLGLERLDLLGHSHGGFVAMAWATAHPERVGRLVLSNTAPRFTDTIRQARRERVAAHEGAAYFADAVAALQAHAQGRYASDEELAALYAREWRVIVPPGFDGARLAEAVMSAEPNADALRHFNDHVAAGMDHRAALAGVRAPVLVITGELDPFGESTAQEIADALPNATLVVLPGSDHFPFLEDDHEAEWSRTVLDFLSY
jgi:pimeloyl-ACP methyl ester carboxylesterase